MENDKNIFFDFIKSRKCIRDFINNKIPRNEILEILECARWAPSGLNNQPWFCNIVTHPSIKKIIAENTKYGDIIESAYLNIVVFLDVEKGYDRVKDILAIGAFMQNILLAVNAMPKLGAVWIGEILNNKEKVNEIFKLKLDKFELMGVICISEIVNDKLKEEIRERRPIEDFIDWY